MPAARARRAPLPRHAPSRSTRAGEQQIQFVSDAPLEKFTGTSSKLSGEIKLDPAKAATDQGRDQGDDRLHQDRHRRCATSTCQAENWLDAKKYPEAKFVITKITGVEALKPSDAADATVIGKFTLHGVTKDVTATAKVR